jgi:hypothetical protein
MLNEKCEECGIGRCQSTVVPFLSSMGARMLVFPNAPATKCDMCGHVAYDPRFLLALQQMFTQLQAESQAARRRHQRISDRPSAWTPARRSG